MWLRHGKWMVNNSSGSAMELSLHRLRDEVLYMTTLTRVRLQHGSEVGICTSASLSRCLCCTAVGLLRSLCPVVNKSVLCWPIPDRNGASSRFMELLVLIPLWLVILCWTHILGFGFCTFFPTPKNWLKTPCTALMSSPTCMFSHVADGKFLYANHECWHIHKESLAILPNPTFLKTGAISVFTCFYFRMGNQKNKTQVQLFL